MTPSGTGNPSASIMLIGESFTQEEERRGEAFLGQAGEALNQMLEKAGLFRGQCFLTNIVNMRPPYDSVDNWIAKTVRARTDRHQLVKGRYLLPPIVEGISRVEREIEMVKPKIIIAFGNLALWALTGAEGIVKWRGSQLSYKGIPVIACLPPYSSIIDQTNKFIITQDLKRAKRVLGGESLPTEWSFVIRPSAKTVLQSLEFLQREVETRPTWLDFDLETRAGHIACAGISWTAKDAICIPFMCVEDFQGYWNEEEESEIVFALYKLLTHPQALIRGQNLLYDAQYTYRHWHFAPNVVQDTMIAHHTCFAGLPKSLAFMASLYCDHYLYWKDDGKTWTKNVGEDQLWAYNAQDCVRTRECGEALQTNLVAMGLDSVDAFQQRLFWPVLRAMQLGVKIDLKERSRLSHLLEAELHKRETWFKNVLGHPLNPRSSLQMTKLFYEDLKQSPIMSKAKKGIPGHLTCDDDALEKLKKAEPLMIPLIKNIAEFRSLGVFRSTFVEAKLDIDQRMRCSYNICGTETYRFNSSKNAFATGTNLQNVPKGDDHDDPNRLSLPNIRTLFIPDDGYTFFDIDLDRADLQVVAWESEEAELKYALAKGIDMHLLNAASIFGYQIDIDLLVAGTESCNSYKKKWAKERQFAKSWVHGTNYGGSAKTMALAAGCTVHESDKAQKQYFGRYAGIRKWHKRTEHSLQTTHSVTNILGYRRFYFDKIDRLLPEALAWVPQSTVACVINRVWVNFYEKLPEVQVLLQVHDSLAGQFPTFRREKILPALREHARITLPYPDPLIIPVGIATSEKSWGHCE